MSDRELLPCPFCGGEAGTGSSQSGCFVYCIDCLASTNILLENGASKERATADWNTRTESVNQKLLKALEALEALVNAKDMKVKGSAYYPVAKIKAWSMAREALAEAEAARHFPAILPVPSEK